MEITLDDQTWRDINVLISKALKARETYRKVSQNTRTSAAAWRPIMQILAKFPEGTFIKNDHTDIVNIDPYGTKILTAFTESIWAFSSGPVLDDLDCPQTASDLFSYYVHDLYQIWYDSEPNEGRSWAALFRTVTNDVADYNLITTDATVREGLVNSPRAAMAAHAWVITNSMTSVNDEAIVRGARQLWVNRCGPFEVGEN